jgi:hypothetical protein
VLARPPISYLTSSASLPLIEIMRRKHSNGTKRGCASTAG